MVRELGFMQATLAATRYAPSAVHALLEIGQHGPSTAAALALALNLEKSSVSRLIRKLIEAGELKESTSEQDARAKSLALTPKGRRTLASIDAFGRRQVESALSTLSAAQRAEVEAGLATYARALESRRNGPSAPGSAPPVRAGVR
ncbi:MarR family winged helix-turn-helix transcriptional regulator [soil metagenome]